MWFSQAPWYTLPVHLCRFRVRSDGGLFPGTSERPAQSDKGEQSLRSVTSSWPTNINVVPIDYAFRPRLRGRLTLLRLALSRNPWTFGDRVSHPVCRYSCQHSRFRSLHRMAYAPASQKEQCVGYVLRSRLTSRSPLHCCNRSLSDHRPAPNIYTQRSISQNAPLPRALLHILSFGSWLEPRYIFAAGQLI